MSSKAGFSFFLDRARVMKLITWVRGVIGSEKYLYYLAYFVIIKEMVPLHVVVVVLFRSF